MPLTIPPHRSAGNTGHITDHNDLADIATAILQPVTIVDAPTGVTATDTAAINTAITAWKAAGYGVLQFALGNYLTSGGHDIGGGDRQGIVTGCGWGTTVKLDNSSNTDMFTFGGVNTNGLTIRDMHLDGNGGNQTAGNIINGYGSVMCRYVNLWIDRPYASASLSTSSTAGIRLYQNGAGNTGQQNVVERCLFANNDSSNTANQIGVMIVANDENWVVDCLFQAFGTSSQSYPSAVYDQSGLSCITGNTFVTGTGIYVGGGGNRSRIIGNMMDGPASSYGQIYLGNSGSLVSGNYCFNIPASKDGIYIDNTDHILVIGNLCETLNNTAATSGIHLGGSPSVCQVSGNIMKVQGSGSWAVPSGISIDSPTAIAGCLIRDNLPGTSDGGNVSGSVTVDWSSSEATWKGTLTGNITTLTLNNPIAKGVYTMILRQGGSGSYTVAWPSSVKWPGGVTPSWGTSVGHSNVVTLAWDADQSVYRGYAETDYAA